MKAALSACAAAAAAAGPAAGVAPSSSLLAALAAAQHRWAHGAAGRALPDDGLRLADFVAGRIGGAELVKGAPAPEAGPAAPGAGRARRRVHVETWGCQMNASDSEVVLAVLAGAGYEATPDPAAADLLLLNTCAIRENAESKVWQRLRAHRNARRAAARASGGADRGPVVGVLGCMAERLKTKLLEEEGLVDLVAGPDAYRDLPRLVSIVRGEGEEQEQEGEGGAGAPATGGRRRGSLGRRASAINVQLSVDETYADVVPVRRAGATSAYLSIMRGCNNMCAFCIVPMTRGRERSRPMQSILDEVRMLRDQGVREVTLLGQNVNSYADFGSEAARQAAALRLRPRGPPSAGAEAAAGAVEIEGEAAGEPDPFAVYAAGFRSVYRPARDGAVGFAELLDAVAGVDREVRVRFTSPHPKDFNEDVLQVIAGAPNICKQLHMPAQSGSTSVLERMRRGYGADAYRALVASARAVLPGAALSTDMIAGFCGEGEGDHEESVALLRDVRYEQAFLFAYSRRDRTHAARHYEDDVPEEVKGRRLAELIAEYRAGIHAAAPDEVGRRHLVLVEGPSRRSPDSLTGRTDTFKRAVFDDVAVPTAYAGLGGGGGGGGGVAPAGPLVRLVPGDYVAVEVTAATGGTVFARPLARTSVAEFAAAHGGSAAPLPRVGAAGGQG